MPTRKPDNTIEMILASAQTKPKRRDIQANLHDHYGYIEKAADHGADLIVFPEMSITGYERKDADSLAFYPDDSRLKNLIQLSYEKEIIVIAGAPVKINSDLYIGSFIFQPDHPIEIYTKQFLHSGEEEFFKPSFDFDPLVDLKGERFSLAICFDIENPVHPKNACDHGCTLYISSIFYSPNGIAGAHQLLGHCAKQFSMPVLMSNFCVESWTLAAGGGSAFWDRNGELIAALDNHKPGLLLVEKKEGIWSANL